MRIMFTGAAPWVNSGYGKPIRNLVPLLTGLGHEVALCAFYGYRGSIAEMEIGGGKLRIYPMLEQPYFNDAIEHHVDNFKADIVITLQDVWILNNWGSKGFIWCPWMPIDTHPVTDMILHALINCHTALCYTKWAQEELNQNGYENNVYMPLGVDTEIYKPMNRARAREKIGLPDRFTVGLVGANSSYPSRKSIPEVVLAWKQWVDNGGEGTLYLHTTTTPKGRAEHGINMIQLLKNLDLPWTVLDGKPEEMEKARVVLPNQYKVWAGTYDDAEMAQIMNCFDVLLEPSMAEGFGIPIIEAQSCGVPVITLNNTSMPELTFAGKILEPLQVTWDISGSWRHIAPIESIYDSIHWAATLSPSERKELGIWARDSVADFDWRNIVKNHMQPFLEEVEAEL